MEKEVFDAIYKTIDGKTTEELLDIVNNHLNDYSDDYKWMVAVVLSKRKVEFVLDDFPRNVSDGFLYYYQTNKHWEPVYVILAVVCIFIALVIDWGASGNFWLMARVTGIAMVLTVCFLVKAFGKDEEKVYVECTGIKSANYTDFVDPSIDNVMQNKTTRDLIVDALNHLNCEPNIEAIHTDDGSLRYEITFFFQAQHFVFMCFDGYLSVDAYYPSWYGVEMDKTAEVERVKSTVNKINSVANVNCFYDIDEDSNTLNLHSSYHFYLFPNTPDVTALFNTIFNDFFRQRRTFEQLLIQAPVDAIPQKVTDYGNIKIQGEC